MGRWVAVLSGIAAIGLLAPEAAQPSPVSARTAIASLGDSFISGEGGRWLGNGSDPFGTRSGTDRAAFACGECRIGCGVSRADY